MSTCRHGFTPSACRACRTGELALPRTKRASQPIRRQPPRDFVNCRHGIETRVCERCKVVVWLSGEGGRYHSGRGCEALAEGQQKAADAGKRPQLLHQKELGVISFSRRPCGRCYTSIGANDLTLAWQEHWQALSDALIRQFVTRPEVRYLLASTPELAFRSIQETQRLRDAVDLVRQWRAG